MCYHWVSNSRCGPTSVKMVEGVGTGETAQWVKALTTKPKDLSLSLGTHVVEGKKHPHTIL